MSKGGGGPKTPPKDPESEGKIQTGLEPYPTNGQFPILAKANYWQDGNFMMPGVAAPMMSSDLLTRFPQLTGLFGGRDPNEGQNSSITPGMYGLPPDFGALNPTDIRKDKDDRPRGKRNTRGPRWG
jgi:hypothetical protein